MEIPVNSLGGIKMSAIDEILSKLKKYPQVSFQVAPHSVTVNPTSVNGFKVSLEVIGGIFRVYFEGWHEEFSKENEALNCFAFGLSEECRLRVV